MIRFGDIFWHGMIYICAQYMHIIMICIMDMAIILIIWLKVMKVIKSQVCFQNWKVEIEFIEMSR